MPKNLNSLYWIDPSPNLVHEAVGTKSSMVEKPVNDACDSQLKLQLKRLHFSLPFVTFMSISVCERKDLCYHERVHTLKMLQIRIQQRSEADSPWRWNIVL